MVLETAVISERPYTIRMIVTRGYLETVESGERHHFDSLNTVKLIHGPPGTGRL